MYKHREQDMNIPTKNNHKNKEKNEYRVCVHQIRNYLYEKCKNKITSI